MQEMLNDYLRRIETRLNSISPERISVLEPLIQYIIQEKRAHQGVPLIFICTHNARRSHMAQAMCIACAEFVGVSGIHSYSGGLEVTAFHPNALAALERAGFEFEKSGDKSNPHYIYSWNGNRTMFFSKSYDDPANPTNDFGAVMVCSDAESNCPYVHGATKRIPVTYDDPKIYDKTGIQGDGYDERCAQIALELLYVMKQVSNYTK